jgi:hypothetical protein
MEQALKPVLLGYNYSLRRRDVGWSRFVQISSHFSHIQTMLKSGENRVELQCLEPGGYQRLAKYMSHHPELSIFRRFGALSNETLLYYQAEIAELETRLRIIQKEDMSSDDLHIKLQGLAWPELARSTNRGKADGDDDSEGDQFYLIMRIRELMGQYRLYPRNSPTLPHMSMLIFSSTRESAILP